MDRENTLPYSEEFHEWLDGLTKEYNTTVSDLYHYWMENVRESDPPTTTITQQLNNG